MTDSNTCPTRLFRGLNEIKQLKLLALCLYHSWSPGKKYYYYYYCYYCYYSNILSLAISSVISSLASSLSPNLKFTSHFQIYLKMSLCSGTSESRPRLNANYLWNSFHPLFAFQSDPSFKGPSAGKSYKEHLNSL